MSNLFKPNSRFAGLTDDIPVNRDKKNDKRNKKDYRNEVKEENKVNELQEDTNKNEKPIEKFNSFKDERPPDKFTLNRFNNNGNNSFREGRYNDRRFDDKVSQHYREQREAEEKARREFEESEKERLKQESLKIENFPDLVIQNKKYVQQPLMNFVETIKKEEEKVSNLKDIDPDLENLKEGWVLYKRDPNTRRTIVKRHPNDIRREVEEMQNSVKSEQEIFNENMNQIIKALSELHERRTNEFIDMYGYDTWEKMFKFPDWREREAELEETDSEDDYYEEEEEEEKSWC
jgi:hypothetical protein